LLTAIARAIVVLAAFAAMKRQSGPMILVVALAGMAAVFCLARIFLRNRQPSAPERGWPSGKALRQLRASSAGRGFTGAA
jgi:hypothetical protein